MYVNEQENDGEKYFLTNNVKDFCEKLEDDWVLHSYLSDQIQADQSIPKLYLDLKKLFDEKIGPSLKGIKLSDIPELSLADLNTTAEEILEQDL